MRRPGKCVARWCSVHGRLTCDVEVASSTPGAVPLSSNNLRQVVHTHVPLSITSRTAATFCGWEGNRKSGVALAMRHRLKWFIHLWAQSLSKGDELHPTYTSHWVNGALFRPDKDADYCDKRVCVCLPACISQKSQVRTSPNFLWPWLGPPLVEL